MRLCGISICDLWFYDSTWDVLRQKKGRIMTVKSFRVTMTDEETRVFQQIKKRLGLRADAEVIRYLINYYYQREFPEKKKS